VPLKIVVFVHAALLARISAGSMRICSASSMTPFGINQGIGTRSWR
jgi:hypothetical protein